MIPLRAHRIAKAAVVAALAAACAVVALDRWVAATVLPETTLPVSTTVVDRDGRLLRAYTVDDGPWRLPVETASVDPGYLAMLIAYEDRRFHSHTGVDLRAMIRAGWQGLTSGRVVSGASTLTMQVARLLEDAPTGRLSSKLRQIRVALALERQLDKHEILNLYLHLAPFGGNIEGIRAASLSWFGKEPRRLTPAEAALMVALPQAPEARRPDRFHARARAARDRVLSRAVATGSLDATDASAARSEPVPDRRRAFPKLSPHLADRLAARDGTVHPTTLDARLQAKMEALLRHRVPALPGTLSAALIVADHRTGEILASVGSPDMLDTRRHGFVDMTRAVRSPGSALKPLIYGLAFEQRIAHPESLIEDRATSFAGYAPTNFDGGFQGTVSLRTALQRSLNVPAVALLDRVGPARLMARLRRAGAEPVLPRGGAPALAIGLGGVGITLRELVAVYAGIARGGTTIELHSDGNPDPMHVPRLLSPEAAWHVADVLSGTPAPDGAAQAGLAFKTGTSYGHRDAWAIGFDGRHVIGVWTGRADAAAVPGITGMKTAAPLLFEAFARLKARPEHLPPPPRAALTVSHAELPVPLRRVRLPGGPARAPHAPEIVFPPDGARVALSQGARTWPLAVKIRRGHPPFSWLVNGAPVSLGRIERELQWDLATTGPVSVTVIDARGHSARTRIVIE